MPGLTPVSVDDIPAVTREGKSKALIEEFLASGNDAAMVTDHKASFAASLKRYVKLAEAPVIVSTRKVEGETRIYLQRSATSDE